MEVLGVTNPAFWSGRRVLITGHTGFKGSWLALWLTALGAEVHGYSTQAPTQPNLFGAARVESCIAESYLADVRDLASLVAAMQAAQPQTVFHLAAQPLVRLSYLDPVETYETNVLGTVHLLEAVRSCSSVQTVVNVTTDKCYENNEWIWPYRENEPLGGRDPYSSSKACAELVTAAYRQSYLSSSGVTVATARAGNVIGGGDWAQNRLLPDVFRSIETGNRLLIRYPDAVRPWQHVLEPLGGYLYLAQQLAQRSDLAGAWNFGPTDQNVCSVARLLAHLEKRIPELRWTVEESVQPHEARQLRLDSSKAKSELGWTQRWSVVEALDHTIDWHLAWRKGIDARALCLAQIDAYQRSTIID